MPLRPTALTAGRHDVLGTFVGRTVEIAEVVGMLHSSPVVTLTGAPGVGKSRLARRLAASRHPGLPACAVTLSFAGIDPTVMPSMVAEATAGQKSPLLLVLDDCDEVASQCAELVHGLVSADGSLRVIVTSRQPLGVGNIERVWRVPSLSLPEPADEVCPERLAGVEAVRLFCDRAQVASPGFSLAAVNAEPVAEICRRLDGIPLAVELAAARVAELSPERIVAGLDDPFTILVDDSAARPPRHRSLRAALEASADRLSAKERVLWRRLSVFGAGFTREAAAQVCGFGSLDPAGVPDALMALSARSLVVSDDTPGPTCFRLLNSVRCLTREELGAAGETEAVAARHGSWCVAAVEAAGDPRRGRTWLQALTPYAASLEAALRWATAAERAQEALCLGSAHVILCHTVGRHDEARAWLDPLIALADRAPGPVRATGLRQAGMAAGLIGEFATSIASLQKSAAVARSVGASAGAVQALSLVAFVSMLACDYEGGLTALDETVTVAELAGDDAGIGQALTAAARAHVLVGDPATGRRRFSESLEVARRVGDLSATANALIGLGWAAFVQGDDAQAELALCEGLALARRLGDMNGMSVALAWLGELSLGRGDNARARSKFEEGAEVARAAGAPYPLGRCLLGLGHLALSLHDTDAAYAHFDQALRIAREANVPFLAGPALRSLAQAAAAAGDCAKSRALLNEAVEVANECGDRAERAACLEVSSDL